MLAYGVEILPYMLVLYIHTISERCIVQIQLCTERHQIIHNREYVSSTAELEPSHIDILHCVARALQSFIMPIAIMFSSCLLIPFPESFRERMEGSFFGKEECDARFHHAGHGPR
jgi:hypothetical protein